MIAELEVVREFHGQPKDVIVCAEDIFDWLGGSREFVQFMVHDNPGPLLQYVTNEMDPRYNRDGTGERVRLERFDVQAEDTGWMDDERKMFLEVAEAMGLTIPEYPFDQEFPIDTLLVTGGAAHEMHRRVRWTQQHGPNSARLWLAGCRRPLRANEVDYINDLKHGTSGMYRTGQATEADAAFAIAMHEASLRDYVGRNIKTLSLLAERPDNLDAIRQAIYLGGSLLKGLGVVTTQLYVPFTSADAHTASLEFGGRVDIGVYAGPSTQEKIDARSTRVWFSEIMKTIASNLRHYKEQQRRL